MAAPIVIQVTLGTDDINRAGQEIARKLQNALDVGIAAARESGRKLGEALSGGLEAGRKRPTEEEKERAHQRRLEAIHEQSAARIREVESRKQAQIDTIRERAVQRQIEQQRRLEQATQQGAGGFQTFLRRFSSTIREAGESIQQAGFAFLGLTNAIIGLGQAAVKSAINIDQQVNVLRALTGSAEQAEKRFASLVATAQKSPGLTTNLAATVDAQLRIVNVTEKTIDRILPAIGKLNAVTPIADPTKFVGNLVQLITQNFERQDLKELVGQSPVAGELIKAVFDVNSPTNAKAIRAAAQKLGITTTEALFTELARAAENNPKLAGIGESLGTQLQKLQDRILVALRPLGIAILNIIVPAVEKLVPIIERLFDAFSKLPSGLQSTIIVFGGLAAAIAPAVIALGGAIQLLGALGNLTTVIAALGGASATAGVAVTGLSAAFPPLLIALGVVVGLIGIGIGAYALYTAATKDDSTAIRENVEASTAQIAAASTQIETLEKLAKVTKLTATEQEQIRVIYDELNPLQKDRVRLFADEAGGVDTVSGKLTGLIGLLKEERAQRQAKAQEEAVDAGKRLAGQIDDLTRALQTNQNDAKRFAEEVLKASRAMDEARRSSQLTSNFFNSPFSPSVENARNKVNDLQLQLDFSKNSTEATRNRLRELALAFQSAAIAAGLTTEEFIKQSFAASGLAIDLDKIKQVLSFLPAAKPTTPTPTPKPTNFGAGTSSKESERRALRQAELRAEQSALQNEFELIKDANERILKENEKFFKLGLISADQFFKDKLGLLQSNIGNEINLLKEQLRAAQEAFNKAKPKTAERVGLEEKIDDLLTKIKIKTLELGDAERQIFSESIEARNKIVDSSKVMIDVIKEVNKAEEGVLKTIREQAKTRDAIIRGAREDLEKRGKDIDRQTLLTGENLDLKVLNAQKEAVLEIKKTDEEAILSMIKNRERLADASIFHADRANAIFLDHLARQQSVTEAVGDAMIRVYEGVAGSLDRGIDKLTKKLGIFGDVLNGILKSVVRNLLANLFAPTFGVGGQGGSGSGGGGGILGGLLNGIFGGGAGGGLLGGLFRTPGTFPGGGGGGGGGGFNFGSIIGLAAGIPGLGAAGSISAPSSVSLPIPGLGTILRATQRAQGGSQKTGLDLLLGNLKGLTQGFGFGLKAGSQAGQLAKIAPLLGLSLGIGAGGTSTLGKIVGGAGGALLGIGLTAAPSFLGSGLVAGLFSNPITAAVGAALLVGAIFLGRASQRRKDESASGDFLTQALNGIQELKRGVSNDSIEGSQAQGIFDNNILGTFIQQINTLKTKSVRESRLTNQVRDLKAVFAAEVVPEIELQRKRRLTSSRLIPEFAAGGVVPGFDLGRDTVLSLLRPREMVLTLEQQASIARMAGADVFARAGIPGIPTSQPPAFAAGGIVPLASAGGNIVIQFDEITIGVSEKDATQILSIGVRSNQGRNILLKANKNARLNRETR
ncbi:MAG: hypothetical protein MOB07_23200 [Acidobacteria bacterium]|nr:hypothetical protein [Acidobacteriota bacterium]